MYFNFNFDSYDVIFEIYIGNALANKQRMQAPKQMLMMNFIQVVEELRNDSRPMKVKMIRQESIFDKFENKYKTLNNEIEFMNNAWVDKEGL